MALPSASVAAKAIRVSSNPNGSGCSKRASSLLGMAQGDDREPCSQTADDNGRFFSKNRAKNVSEKHRRPEFREGEKGISFNSKDVGTEGGKCDERGLKHSNGQRGMIFCQEGRGRGKVGCFDGGNMGGGLADRGRPIGNSDGFEVEGFRGGDRKECQEEGRKQGLVSKIPVQQKEGGLSVVLDMEAEEEVKQNVSIFSELGLIGRLCGIWPSLSELHSWISENWGPLITGNVQIYPAAKGFFIVVFGNIEDKKMVLCDHFWCWEDQNVLMLKPWHPKFCPDSESFEKIPIWVRLPYFPLHLWFNSCLETIGNSLGEFLLVDEGSSNLLHSTYAQILVEMNISLGLPADIEIKTSNGSWFQPLDYEGIPFRCRQCHQVGHLAVNFSKE